MTTIQEVNSAIMFGDFSNDQLNSIIGAIKYRRGQITQSAKRSFRVGSKVKFYSDKRGQIFVGTIEKMAIKFATINTSTGTWKVPANMLEAA
jgi:hypothetical protein